MRCFFLTALALLTGGTLSADAPKRWLTGDAADVVVQPQGGLLLMGGGGDVDEAVRWFLQKAQGGDVVVLRASGRDGYNDYFFEELGVTVNSVETLLFRSRQEAFDPAAATTIAQAEAVFLAGGDQSKYVSFWRETPVGEALNAHLAAGKPLGGTSAGLAVMGAWAYSAEHRGDLTSALALEFPEHPYITLREGFLRAPLLKGILTDSHFTERARLGRLMVMRTQAEAKAGEPIIGLGVDEATALCVEANGEARLLSSDDGTATLVLPDNQVIMLGTQSRWHFRERTVDRPLAVEHILIKDGQLVRAKN